MSMQRDKTGVQNLGVVQEGSFTLQSEEEIMIEQKLFLEKLLEMDSYYVNEHIVNLLLEVRGNLQTDKMEMLSAIDNFLGLPEDEKLLFIIGRRLNIFFFLDDLKIRSYIEKHRNVWSRFYRKIRRWILPDFVIMSGNHRFRIIREPA